MHTAKAGNIELFANGYIDGWMRAGAGQARLKLRIDGKVLLETEADRFRKDLSEVGIRSGFAHFRVPVPLRLQDGREHLVEAYLEAEPKAVISARLTLSVPAPVQALRKSAIWASGPIRWGGRKTAFFCGYSADGQLSANTRNIIGLLRAQGYYVVLILAAAYHQGQRPPANSGADVTLVRFNEGYDFGSWACAYALATRATQDAPSELLLINDSMVWTGHPLKTSLLSLRRGRAQYDVVGITDSYERRYHLQSYCLNFSGELVRSGLLDEFLMYQAQPSSVREEVISQYELRTWRFFSERGCRVRAALPYEDLISQLLPALQQQMAWYRSRFDRRSCERLGGHESCMAWLDVLLKGMATNPTHICWQQICAQGFPFIKREVIVKNPVNAPLVEHLRAAFVGPGVTAVEDLLRNANDTRAPQDVLGLIRKMREPRRAT